MGGFSLQSAFFLFDLDLSVRRHLRRFQVDLRPFKPEQLRFWPHSRIELVRGGYRAVLLCEPPRNWKQQLRMPLIQSAIAQKYGVPVQEFEVGTQCLDGSGLTTARFFKRELNEAKEESRKLGEMVKSMAS